MSTTFTIAKREFRSYFDSPVAYVVICLSLFVIGLLFFNFFWQANRANLQYLFSYFPYLLLISVSAITMRLLAAEKGSGTLEMLITLPVRDHEVILGKYIGALSLVLVLIVSTTIFPIALFGFPWDLGSLDAGPVSTGYLGLILYAAATCALGLLVSALTDSQIIAFFITLVILGLLHFVGGTTVLNILPDKAETVIAFISTQSRLVGFERGVINSRDVVYFLSITVGCLLGAFWALERRKWA